MLCVEYKTLRWNGHLFVIYIQNLILRIKVCPFLSRDGIEWTLGLCLISHLFLYDFCQAPFSTTRPRETYSMFLNFFLIVKYLGGSFLMINERNMKVIFHLIWFPRLWLYVISIGAFFFRQQITEQETFPIILTSSSDCVIIIKEINKNPRIVLNFNTNSNLSYFHNDYQVF